jgi:peptide/nickel transport system substrate-binding protein
VVIRSTVFARLLILAVTACAGCGVSANEEDAATIYIHLGAEPGHLNPITSNEAVTSSINEHIYESLLDRDNDTLVLMPQLAESWQVSPDGLVYVFRLKKGVQWSDGVEFTADDVVYSFGVIKDPKTACAPLKVYYIDVQSVEKVDRYTVAFRYSKQYFRALEICGTIPLVPRHVFDDGTDFNSHRAGRHPVGTGPFMFERWDTGKRISLVRNDRYRGRSPEIHRIVYKVVQEPNVALQMLKKGEIDLMTVRPIQWVRQTNTEKFLNAFYKLEYYNPNYNYIGWNAQRPLFSDRRVRVALTHMVNRDAILEKLNFGLGKVVSGTSYINSRAYNSAVKPWPYDPERARAILREAGWADTDNDGVLDKNGVMFSFRLTISSASKFSERLATILKEDLSRNGIEMDILRYEWAVFVQKLDARDFDAVTLGWSLGFEEDPYQLWHSSQIAQGSNHCSFSNAEADGLIERFRVEFNEEARIRMLHRLHEILHEEQPYTFLFCNPNLAVVSRRFGNVKVHPKGLDLNEWTVIKKYE